MINNDLMGLISGYMDEAFKLVNDYDLPRCIDHILTYGQPCGKPNDKPTVW